MVVRRPKLPKKDSKKDPDKAETQLMEHLVKKTLDINPDLGKDEGKTKELMSVLRGEKPAPTKDPKLSPKDQALATAKRRLNTISFFFEQKQEEYQESMSELRAQLEVIQAQQQQLKNRISQELVDFLTLMSGAGDSPESREVMRNFRELLEQLGVSDSDLAKRARQS